MTSDLPAILGGTACIRTAEHRPWPNIDESDRRAVLRVLDRGILSGSHAPEALALEERFAEYVGAKFCLLTHCGTSALQLALAASGVEAGDEVIVPAYSFIATPLAVVLQGATPVFVDVDPVNGHLDLDQAAAAVTPATKAIMPVHIHGQASDMPAILALAQRSGLRVVEDAAQAHGATVAGKAVGALGSAGGFSLQSSKNLGAGEGGLFVTNDPGGAEIANHVRNFGQSLRLSDAADFDPTHPLDGTRSLESVRLGSMYRGNEMTAALAHSQLKRLPERTRHCCCWKLRRGCRRGYGSCRELRRQDRFPIEPQCTTSIASTSTRSGPDSAAPPHCFASRSRGRSRRRGVRSCIGNRSRYPRKPFFVKRSCPRYARAPPGPTWHETTTLRAIPTPRVFWTGHCCCFPSRIR